MAKRANTHKDSIVYAGKELPRINKTDEMEKKFHIRWQVIATVALCACAIAFVVAVLVSG